MYQTKYLRGPTTLADLIRSPKGTFCIYEVLVYNSKRTPDVAHMYAHQHGGKVKTEMIHGYVNVNEPICLLRVTVVRKAGGNTYKKNYG